MNDDIRGLVTELRDGNTAPGDETYLRRAVVTAVSGASATIMIGGASIAGVPFYTHTPVRVNDVVDVLFDGPTPRILGTLGGFAASVSSIVGYARVSKSTGGASNGLRGAGYGGGQGSIAVTTTQVGLGLGCINIPVTPGNIIRSRWRFAAFGPTNTATEWYFYNMVSENGGAYYNYTETREAPSGLNAPSPQGEMLYVVPPGVTSISVGVDARVQSGNGGTLFRYAASDEYFQSFMTVEDLGPSAPQPVILQPGTQALTKFAEVTLAADAASITIAGIPQTARHLQVEHSLTSARPSGGTDGIRLRLNGSASGYAFQENYDSGTSRVGNRFLGQSAFNLGECANYASVPGGGRFTIRRYTAIDTYKSIDSMSGGDQANIGPWSFTHTGYWPSNDPVTSLTIFSSTGSNFRAGSVVSVYGLP